MSGPAQVKTEYAQNVQCDGHITVDACLRYPTTSSVKCELGGASFASTATVGDAIEHFRPLIKDHMEFDNDDFDITAYRHGTKEAGPSFRLSDLEIHGQLHFQTKAKPQNAPKTDRMNWKKESERLQKELASEKKARSEENEAWRKEREAHEDSMRTMKRTLEGSRQAPPSPAPSSASTAFQTPSHRSSSYSPSSSPASVGPSPSSSPAHSSSIHVNAPSTSSASQSHQDKSIKVGTRAQVGNAGHGAHGAFGYQAAEGTERMLTETPERIREQCDTLKESIVQEDSEQELRRIEEWMKQTNHRLVSS